MASVTMLASFLGGATLSNRPTLATSRRSLVMARAAAEGEKVKYETKKETAGNGRRDLVFSATAAAVCLVAGLAVAGEPKKGTPEARKIYAPVCVTMPTAKICHK